jgi:hypothetical protein
LAQARPARVSRCPIRRSASWSLKLPPVAARALASGKALATETSGDPITPPPVSRPATPLVGNSALTTYRDQESGRLIVRVFDRQSGDVLMEFPPEGARQIPRSILPAATPKPLTDVDA